MPDFRLDTTIPDLTAAQLAGVEAYARAGLGALGDPVLNSRLPPPSFFPTPTEFESIAAEHRFYSDLLHDIRAARGD